MSTTAQPISPVTGRRYTRADIAAAGEFLYWRWGVSPVHQATDHTHPAHAPAALLIEQVCAYLRQTEDAAVVADRASREMDSLAGALRSLHPLDVIADYAGRLQPMIGYMQGLEHSIPVLIWHYLDLMPVCEHGLRRTVLCDPCERQADVHGPVVRYLLPASDLHRQVMVEMFGTDRRVLTAGEMALVETEVKRRVG